MEAGTISKIELRKNIAILFIFTLIFISIPVYGSSDNESRESINVQERILIVEQMIREAFELYKQGKVDDAYKVARDAYIDHFEIIEIPLRSIDPDFTLDMEVKFAEFREMIRTNAGIEDVESKMQEILVGLEKVSKSLEDPGLLAAAASLLTIISFSIMLREGFEAVLLLSIIISLILATKSYELKKHVATGAMFALVLSIVTWIIIDQLIGLATRFRPIIEAVLTSVAVAILFYISFWILNNTHTKKWLEFVKAKVWEASAKGAPIAIVLLAFTTIYREGLETVIFYQTLLLSNVGMEMPIFLGALIGFGAVGILALLVFVAGKKIPTRLFFIFTMLVTAYLSIVFIGNAVKELQELGIVSVTVVDIVPRSRILTDLTGIYPTLETLTAQVALVSVYVSGYIYMIKRRFG